MTVAASRYEIAMTTIPLMTAQLGPAQVSEQVTHPWWTKPATAALPDHQ
jgi:hypothetical protein